MIKKKKSKALTSAEMDMFIEMIGVPAYDDILETLRAISENEAEAIRLLTEYKEYVIEVGDGTSIGCLIQPENFLLLIPDSTYLDIAGEEIFQFEPEDLSFLLEESTNLF